ncbi:MAG: hypothetical protein F6K24_24260 [Okeania sp. SIO2D1]|uniref:hypothetical protein n=1 Tax=Okeania sp. SIO2C9 TaxID=2607791 RepID=UPI0013B85416|nr:hypothetical protein [Okeania sp. SIO2C9]NEQ72627.1 hypothetical protein [Okeania sp. SIO2C9]NES68127.1 hypothetical protein [Okeania sp. SIO2D1]
MNSEIKKYPSCSLHQDVSEYVADLQFHMTLHARNLVPSLNQVKDGREEMLQQTQAHFEKLISRQTL